ncbi:MAG: YHYH protein, partial [Planctomycetaceae bacterium]
MSIANLTSLRGVISCNVAGSLRLIAMLAVAIGSVGLNHVVASDAVDPNTLKHLAGHWFVSQTEPAIYYYKDAAHYLDLFSYHRKDSNKDGIDNLVLSHTETHLIVDSQGYPNHPTAIFPNSGNPNRIEVQKFRFQLPLEPKLNDHITRLPMGPIGTAVNGVVYFNPFEQGGMNAVEGYSEVWLDSCCGHPQQNGVYHYHKYPVCVKSPFKDNGKQHSPVIGFAFDGFPIYGPYESDGLMAKDAAGQLTLDACNGHTDSVRGYHYHVTPGRFPYIIGGYAGVPELANIRGRRGLETGAIEDNSSGESSQPKVIVAVRPASGQPGKKQTLEIELDPSQATRARVPEGAPDWVQVGPFEAISIERTGDILHVEIQIPDDATLGVLMDCHIEFKAANRPRAV